MAAGARVLGNEIAPDGVNRVVTILAVGQLGATAAAFLPTPHRDPLLADCAGFGLKLGPLGGEYLFPLV
jgi:hypothetical protein